MLLATAVRLPAWRAVLARAASSASVASAGRVPDGGGSCLVSNPAEPPFALAICLAGSREPEASGNVRASATARRRMWRAVHGQLLVPGDHRGPSPPRREVGRHDKRHRRGGEEQFGRRRDAASRRRIHATNNSPLYGTKRETSPETHPRRPPACARCAGTRSTP